MKCRHHMLIKRGLFCEYHFLLQCFWKLLFVIGQLYFSRVQLIFLEMKKEKNCPEVVGPWSHLWLWDVPFSFIHLLQQQNLWIVDLKHFCCAVAKKSHLSLVGFKDSFGDLFWFLLCRLFVSSVNSLKPGATYRQATGRFISNCLCCQLKTIISNSICCHPKIE